MSGPFWADDNVGLTASTHHTRGIDGRADQSHPVDLDHTDLARWADDGGTNHPPTHDHDGDN